MRDFKSGQDAVDRVAVGRRGETDSQVTIQRFKHFEGASHRSQRGFEQREVMFRLSPAQRVGINAQAVALDPVDDPVAMANPVFGVVTFVEFGIYFGKRPLISAAVQLLGIGEKSVQVKNCRVDHG